MALKIIWDSQKRSEEQAVMAIKRLMRHQAQYGHDPYLPNIENAEDAVCLFVCGDCEENKVWVKKGVTPYCDDCKAAQAAQETQNRIEQLGRIKALDKATGGAEGITE